MLGSTAKIKLSTGVLFYALSGRSGRPPVLSSRKRRLLLETPAGLEEASTSKTYQQLRKESSLHLRMGGKLSRL